MCETDSVIVDMPTRHITTSRIMAVVSEGGRDYVLLHGMWQIDEMLAGMASIVGDVVAEQDLTLDEIEDVVTYLDFLVTESAKKRWKEG
jgi:hypothetical protein